MDARTKWLLIATAAVGIAITAVMITIEPRLITWIVWSLTAAFLLWIIMIVAVTIMMTAFSTPPPPLSEISILDRWVVRLTKIALALLAFFANTATSWLLSISVLRPPPPRHGRAAHPSRSGASSCKPSQSWPSCSGWA